MKKSTLKKLALHKETLRSLHEWRLTDAAGEAPGDTFSRFETCGIIPCTNFCSGTCLPSNCGVC